MGEKNLFIPGAIIVAGVIIAAAVVYVGGFRGARPGDEAAGANGPSQGGAQSGLSAASNLADDDPSLGDPSAPVTFVEFGDFQCPFCGRFFSEAERKIIEKYVKTGKVRFIYRDFAFLGPESEWAAQAAECADEQGKFWPYHDYLYSNQQGENQGAFSRENLKRFALKLGLETSQFNSCLDSGKYLEEVRKDTADGRSAGVSGTPANFINGQLLVGALPFSQFEALIENALAGKQ